MFGAVVVVDEEVCVVLVLDGVELELLLVDDVEIIVVEDVELVNLSPLCPLLVVDGLLVLVIVVGVVEDVELDVIVEVQTPPTRAFPSGH